jgi:uncharacterized protein (TIGR02300 family)
MKEQKGYWFTMANRGLKRICASCGTKFYDMGKFPIICPNCGAEFDGAVEVKSRRSRSTIAPDTVKRDEIEAKNREAMEEDDTVSLDDIDENDDDDLDDDLDDMHDLDDNADDDDDLSDLDGDIDVDIDDDNR